MYFWLAVTVESSYKIPWHDTAFNMHPVYTHGLLSSLLSSPV